MQIDWCPTGCSRLWGSRLTTCVSGGLRQVRSATLIACEAAKKNRPPAGQGANTWTDSAAHQRGCGTCDASQQRCAGYHNPKPQLCQLRRSRVDQDDFFSRAASDLASSSPRVLNVLKISSCTDFHRS